MRKDMRIARLRNWSSLGGWTILKLTATSICNGFHQLLKYYESIVYVVWLRFIGAIESFIGLICLCICWHGKGKNEIEQFSFVLDCIDAITMNTSCFQLCNGMSE